MTRDQCSGFFEVDPGEEANRDGGPDVHKVVGGPEETAVEHDDRVSVTEDLIFGKLVAQKPEEKDNDNTQRKADECLGVLTANTPHLLGTDGAPHDGSSEERVDTGAGEAEGGIGGAYVLEVDLLLNDSNADKGGHDGRDHLGGKGVARGNLDVVSEL